MGIWKDLDELTNLRAIREKYEPKMDEFHREKNWHGWQKAVERSLGWVESEEKLIVKANKMLSLEGPIALLAFSGLALGVGFLLGQSRKK